MFKIGDIVLCINIDRVVNCDGVSTPWEGLKLNEFYTLSRIYPTSVTLVELTDTYAHSKWRFKTMHEIRLDKILKIKERICLKSVIE